MSQHTDGPWEVARIDDERAYAHIETVKRGTDVPDKGYEIAYVSASTTCRANADLIAAAPELLAACEDLLFFCEEMNPRETMRDLWDRARAAIRRARGDA